MFWCWEEVEPGLGRGIDKVGPRILKGGSGLG